MLDDVEQRLSGRRYVMVDDKLRILTAMKEVWGDRLTTVFVRQGHYAHDAESVATYPALTSRSENRGPRRSRRARLKA